MLTHRPPEGWAGATAWREEAERVVSDQVRPAISRYADVLTELLPRSRPPERAGLLHVPGGVPAYASCVRNGTTLPFDPDELHRLGLDALAEIEDQIGELGRAALGTSDIGDTMVRFRKDPALTAPDGAAAMARAAAAIARAEERLPDMFRSPLPPPCAVEPMPPHMARFGAPPYYSPPARDGSRPGAYLFNDVQPGQAGSWALEATAFHEGVPGHHAQFARVQLLPHLPLLQAASSACTPTTCSGSACSAVPPGAPSGSSSTAGCTPAAGAGRGPGSSRWRTRPCPRTLSMRR
jgi:uncharacterized protein (DUF885 family)